jgi:hypothetical protein
MRIPYDTILQHASHNLRAITLDGLRQLPAVLQHLVDHCPSLQRLVVSSRLLIHLQSYKKRFASLLERASELDVRKSPPKDVSSRFWPADSDTDLSDAEINAIDVIEDPSAILSALNSILVECERPLPISTFKFGDCIHFRHSIEVKNIVDKMPRLESVSVHTRDVDPTFFAEMFCGCGSLRTIDRIGASFSSPAPWANFGIIWLRRMKSSRVGINIRFYVISGNEGTEDDLQDISILDLMLQTVSGLEVIRILQKCGLSEPVSLSNTLSFIVACFHLRKAEFVPLLKLLVAPADGNPIAPFLPTPADLKAYLTCSLHFWDPLVVYSPMNILLETLEVMGPRSDIPLLPEEALYLAMARDPWDETILIEMERKGLFERSIFKRSTPKHAPHYFWACNCFEAVKWLLDYFGLDEALKQLLAPWDVFSHYGQYLICTERLGILHRLIPLLGPASQGLLTFPNDATFALICNVLNSHSDLQLIDWIRAIRGANNIGSILRGNLVVDCIVCAHEQRNIALANNTFTYWHSMIVRDGVRPDFTNRVLSLSSLANSFVTTPSPSTLSLLICLIREFNEDMVNQVPRFPSQDLPIFLRSFFQIALRSHFSDLPKETSMLLDNFIKCVAASASRRGLPACTELVSAQTQLWNANMNFSMPKARELFAEIARFDFSDATSFEFQSGCRARLRRLFIRAAHESSRKDDKSIFIAFVDWLEYLDATELNSDRSGVCVMQILVDGHYSNHFEGKTELIRRLVGRGARLPEQTVCELDPEAIKTYRDALGSRGTQL